MLQSHARRRRLAGTVAILAGVSISASGPARGQPPSQARVAITQPLPALDGSRLEATVVEVTYAPGGANPPHRHPCPVIGYVLEGRLRMRVTGQAERTYGPGDSFYESPEDVHVVSANASADQPARFLAYFVCNRKTPLSVPIGAGRELGR